MRSYLLKLLLVLVLLSACARINSRFANPTPSSLPAGNHNRSLTVDSLERTYILHVPPAVEKGTALPLIIVLHGTWGTGRKMQIGLGFDPYADRRSFYVAYPNAYQHPDERKSARWNDGRGTLPSSQENIDDVKFIVEMIADIAGKVPLDQQRVYVTGASNGGIMTYRLGCETKGIFAGIAPVIGNIAQPIFAGCAPQAPIAFLSINGDADPFIPISGGEVCQDVRFGCEGGMVVSTADSVNVFRTANGCQAESHAETLPKLVDDGTSIERLTYSGCGNGVQVVAYVVHHGGHTWPPRNPQLPSGGQSTKNLDATQTIVNYFLP